ncbi:MAG: hypothetical protein RB296_02060 [Acidobacteriota bacterium]|jgi:quercetin dioxygenase-like cupin family protein|nr:hypothetical protein [Acidobacteriota bacterium]
MSQNPITNVLTDAPWSDNQFGRRVVVETDELMVMHIALRPGQEVPLHRANSNVHLLVLAGTIRLQLDGVESIHHAGELVPVVFQTPMRIQNDADSDVIFLVLKTPHPSRMQS